MLLIRQNVLLTGQEIQRKVQGSLEIFSKGSASPKSTPSWGNSRHWQRLKAKSVLPAITNEEGWLKRGFNSDTHRPLFAIMNPELTYTVNPFQTACGIVDIMMHTLERYFCLNEGNELYESLWMKRY